MCAVEAQRCVDCVSAVLRAVLTFAATLRALFDANRRAWRSWISCALVDKSTYLSTTTTETLADSPSGSDWRMGQLLNLAERRWGLTTAREPVAHRPGQRPIPLGVGSLISHSHVGGCVP
jgi:hypothetical protein